MSTHRSTSLYTTHTPSHLHTITPSYLKIKYNFINSNLLFSCVILQHTSQEALREIESRNPEYSRLPIFNPAIEEIDPLNQISYVLAKRLQTRVGLSHPQLRDLVIKKCLAGLLKLAAHHDIALQRILDIIKRASDHIDQPIEPLKLLSEYRIHALRVVNRVLLLGFFKIKWFREAFQNTINQFIQHFLL